MENKSNTTEKTFIVKTGTKQCPFISNPECLIECLGEMCALWCHSEDCCAILDIAKLSLGSVRALNDIRNGR